MKLYVYHTAVEGQRFITEDANRENPAMRNEYPKPLSSFTKSAQAKFVQSYLSDLYEEPRTLKEAREWLKENPQIDA